MNCEFEELDGIVSQLFPHYDNISVMELIYLDVGSMMPTISALNYSQVVFEPCLEFSSTRCCIPSK